MESSKSILAKTFAEYYLSGTQAKKDKQAQKQTEYEAKKTQDEQRKQAILKKLNITEDEAKLILK